MTISTRLTERLGITHPIISAPMDLIAGGRLAAAVSAAGGLGLLGGGYSDEPEWFDREFAAAGNQAVGCGFITWALRARPELLDRVIARKPKAIFLSFDDPEPFAGRIKAAGIPLFCQLQTRADAERALDCGADVIVAQGTEGGGHGGIRATLTLVPEIADLIASRAPQTLLCAAGGIADGRGLAAALMLGADGVVVGTRFWASREALVHPNLHDAAVAAGGDDTARQSVLDIVRGRPWPARYTGRVLKNAFVREWLGREEELRSARDEQATRYRAAAAAGDTTIAATIVGEAVGLIHAIEPAGRIVERMVAQAETALRRGAALAG
ncbi:MAG TPA: nitronate monooxygenase [Hyphomicrobiaceae bacterium]|nr:nitronate monooxygenase [Hyphomicrobiaceae bacterium]